MPIYGVRYAPVSCATMKRIPPSQMGSIAVPAQSEEEARRLGEAILESKYRWVWTKHCIVSIEER